MAERQTCVQKRELSGLIKGSVLGHLLLSMKMDALRRTYEACWRVATTAWIVLWSTPITDWAMTPAAFASGGEG
jgi:hypothetical protein